MIGKLKGTLFHLRPHVALFGQCLLLICICASSCKNLTNSTSAPDVTFVAKSQKRVTIDSFRSNFSGLRNQELVYQFYKINNFQPIWYVGDSLSLNGDSLIRFIDGCRYFGLRRTNYHIDEIGRLNDSSKNVSAEMQRVELLLSDAFLSLAHDLKHGYFVKANSDSAEEVKILGDAIKTTDVVAALKKLQPQSIDYSIAQRYLSQLLDKTDSITRQNFIRGTEVDSSEATRQFRKVELNLHRWRRDREEHGRYIRVNIPAYELKIYDHDTIVLTSKVIVGRKEDPTPVLSGMIRSFVLFPHWTVPRRIAVNELLPQIQRDSTYLQSHRYEVLDPNGNVVDPTTIDFKSLHKNDFPYTLRQDQGEGNALGLIKFSFSNPYSIYLHDTNARYLFKKDKRAISHGCVRVEKALDIARYLLVGNDIVSPEDLDQYLELGRQETIRLHEPIPLYIRYYTIGIENGEVKEYDDVYKVDEREFSLLKDSTTMVVINQ